MRHAAALTAAVLAAPLLAAHAQAPRCEAGAAASVAPLLVQPLVNGGEREVAAIRFVAPDGPLYIDETVLAQWGIATGKLALQDFAGARWLCVEGLGLQYRLDRAQLTMAIDFPLELYAGSSASFASEDRSVPVSYAPGGFFNYDLRFDRTLDSRSAGRGSVGRSGSDRSAGRPAVCTSGVIVGPLPALAIPCAPPPPGPARGPGGAGCA